MWQYRKQYIIVNYDELNNALLAQGVPEDFNILGDWFGLDAYGSNCYCLLDQNFHEPIKNAESPTGVQRNFVLACLRDMFGDEDVLVAINL